eukprot:6969071-Prorocentrum_lima.AAC.1
MYADPGAVHPLRHPQRERDAVVRDLPQRHAYRENAALREIYERYVLLNRQGGRQAREYSNAADAVPDEGP